MFLRKSSTFSTPYLPLSFSKESILCCSLASDSASSSTLPWLHLDELDLIPPPALPTPIVFIVVCFWVSLPLSASPTITLSELNWEASSNSASYLPLPILPAPESDWLSPSTFHSLRDGLSSSSWLSPVSILASNSSSLISSTVVETVVVGS